MSTTKPVKKELPQIQLNVAELKMADQAMRATSKFNLWDSYGHRFQEIIRLIQTNPLMKYTTIRRAKLIAIDVYSRHIQSHTPERFKAFLREMDNVLDYENLSLMEFPNRGPKDVDYGYAYQFFPINWNWLWQTSNQFSGRRVA